ncbi:protoporphyrinogen oxidase [Armatimonas rosea]|uniref:Coproporphyrinogen III oxidase n=1 Tax=Armatimonas rosea TaxID=685828 RepID=A0A7W9SR30_ARMRO|nr:protoporphyrinogen oxidase [Armatimonas rosea]MBB6050663.1 oxygen-dependent protoporphyrinogen oxidase [Armatimonas rosea]
MIAIIGGGISGLSAAWFAQKRGLDYTLIESSGRWGGKLQTEKIDGFVVEGGADSFLATKPWAAQLARELGLGERLLGTNDQLRTIYILHQGQPVALPDGMQLIVPTKLWPFLQSPLLSWPGKLRMGLDWLLPARTDPADETVGSFVRRRFGQEALERLGEPLLSGIYSGESERQSLLATFPRYRELETEFGSLIRGTLAQKAKLAQASKGGKRPSMFQSFPGGTQELVDALVGKLTGPLKLNTAVTALTQTSTGYTLTLSDGTTLDAAQVIVTTPASVAATLVEPFAPRVAEQLELMRAVSTGTLSLGFRTDEIKRPLHGFGMVIPLREKRPINALTISSVKFPSRAPEGQALVRVFFGGSRTPETLEKTDDEILAMAREQLLDILGITAEPLFHRIFRWHNANPQYDAGHLDRIAVLEKSLPPGLHLTGCAYRGVGIPDCIHQAEETVERL